MANENLDDRFVTRREFESYQVFQKDTFDRTENSIREIQKQTSNTNASVIRIETMIANLVDDIRDNRDSFNVVKNEVEAVNDRVMKMELTTELTKRKVTRLSSNSKDNSRNLDDETEDGSEFDIEESRDERNYGLIKVLVPTAITTVGAIIVALIGILNK